MAEQISIDEAVKTVKKTAKKAAPKRKAPVKRKAVAKKAPAKNTAAKRASKKLQPRRPLLISLPKRRKTAAMLSWPASASTARHMTRRRSSSTACRTRLEERRKKAEKAYKELVKRGKKVEKTPRGAVDDIELPKFELESLTDRKKLDKQLNKGQERALMS